MVLLIAGLLVAMTASSASRELVSATRAKALAREITAVRVALETYQDRFHQLPGDDPAASTHVPGAVTVPGAGNGVIDGLWNDGDASAESMQLWNHLRLAGLLPLPESPDADPRPRHLAEGRVGVSGATPAQRQVAGLGGTLQVCAGSVPGRLAILVDRYLDDGNPATGAVRLVPEGSPRNTPAVAAERLDDAASYVVCQGS